ncbi:MAG: flagellar basal body L-ring protein FlgH [Myxococcales bacterium]|nr:flagellar basal body L-ring protein FlgH [Myxococcales bacterium]
MEETLVKAALNSEREAGPQPEARPRPGLVASWLGSRFMERAIEQIEARQERPVEVRPNLQLTVLLFLLFAAVFALGACASTHPVPMQAVNGYKVADFTSDHVPGRTKPSRGMGSLWPGEHFRNLISDHRAAFVNDLVTVEIVEESTAKGTATTKTGRSSDIGMGVSGLLGFEQSIAKARPNMNLETLVGAKTSNSFDGSGETTRTTTVAATITCSVVEVYPNGNLLIRGKRMIKVNGEDQVITLSGIIRPEDINGENTIESTRIADARVTYWGVGVLADKQKPGWMTRALDNVWPF